LPVVEDAPLQGPFVFNPGVALVAGSLPEPIPVVPGVVAPFGADTPDVPPTEEPPIEPLPALPPVDPLAAPPPAAPPPAPPAPPPAAKAKLLETANVAANITVAIFMTSSGLR
jgi:hypothetical protein